MAYYVIGEGNNFYEGMTKEQILAAITQAIETHTITDVDTGFVTKLKEKNKNNQLSVWVGTEAEYNAIQEKDANTLYIKTDDSTLEAINETFETLDETLDDCFNRLSTLEEMKDDLYFKISDTGELNWKGAGFVSGGGANIYFTMPLPKFLPSDLKLQARQDGSDVEVTARQNGNYLLGSASGATRLFGSYLTIVSRKNVIDVKITNPSGSDVPFPNVTNNDTVGIDISIKYLLSRI